MKLRKRKGIVRSQEVVGEDVRELDFRAVIRQFEWYRECTILAKPKSQNFNKVKVFRLIFGRFDNVETIQAPVSK